MEQDLISIVVPVYGRKTISKRHLTVCGPDLYEWELLLIEDCGRTQQTVIEEYIGGRRRRIGVTHPRIGSRRGGTGSE